mmetsp:Transcript_10327/g.30800  ORF Transcript_10327/g.30800 Transcript_10327/m.30800 type:complete len:439 (-) Transcript_10327:314-1630(-)
MHPAHERAPKPAVPPARQRAPPEAGAHPQLPPRTKRLAERPLPPPQHRLWHAIGQRHRRRPRAERLARPRALERDRRIGHDGVPSAPLSRPRRPEAPAPPRRAVAEGRNAAEEGCLASRASQGRGRPRPEGHALLRAAEHANSNAHLGPAGGGVRARRGPRVETADAARVLKARRRDRREPALPGELPQADEGPHLAAAPPVLEGRPRSRTPRSVPVPPGAERGAGSGVQETAGGGAGWRSRPVLPLPRAEGGALAAAPDLGGGAHALDPNSPLRDVRPPLVERVQWRVGHESGRRLAERQASRVPAQPLPKLGADAVAVDGRLQRGRRREPAGPRAPLVVVSCDGEDVAHPVEVVRPVLPPLEADPDLRVRPAVEHLDQLALPQRQGVLHLLPLEPRLPALVQQVVAKERRVLFVGDEGGGGAHGRGAGRPSRGPPR